MILVVVGGGGGRWWLMSAQLLLKHALAIPITVAIVGIKKIDRIGKSIFSTTPTGVVR